MALDDLPALDAVVLSHDHYDHLDMATVRRLDARGVRFIAPLGVGAHLKYWGVAADRITELEQRPTSIPMSFDPPSAGVESLLKRRAMVLLTVISLTV